MNKAYGVLRPNQSFHLAVSGGHQIWVTDSGNPHGLPVILLHGGPGGGLSPYGRRLYDPERYRIIQFDQRGCGDSLPYCELTHNTTADGIADIEAIAAHLGINQWVVAGGSWGVTLALAYAQQYPQRVMGLILRGVFLARDKDLDWLYGGGAGRVFPDYWAPFTDFVGGLTGTALLSAYYEALMGDDEVHRMSAAVHWVQWETHCMALLPNPKANAEAKVLKTSLPMACISSHFMLHRCFLQENQLVDNMSKIAHIPAYIVHGRYDMVCPADNAYDVAQVWPAAELDIVREAGHTEKEPGITDALLRASHRLAERLGVPSGQA